MDGRIRAAALAGLLIGVAALPLGVGVLEPDRAVSTAEMRHLSPLPGVPRSRAQALEWPRRFESYYSDHFGLREPLALAYAWLRYQIGDSPSSQVLRGREGWLYLHGAMHGDPVGDFRHRNRFTSGQLEAFVRALRQRRDWLAARGAAYLFVVAPNKHTIYPEYLPAYLTRLAPDSALDQLVRRVEAAGDVPFLDLRPALRRAREGGRRVFHRTDSHWNAWGADAAQYALMQRLARSAVVPLEPRRWPADAFRWVLHDGGDLARLMGLQRVLREWVPETDLPACGRTGRSLSVQPRMWETVCRGGVGTALIFRDSFFDALQPFVSTYFERVIYVDHRSEPALMAALVERHRPQVVIEEWVERLLPMVPPAWEPGGW